MSASSKAGACLLINVCKVTFFFFLLQEKTFFFHFTQKSLAFYSLVPPMILLTKLDETLILNGIIMVLSSSLVRWHKGGA